MIGSKITESAGFACRKHPKYRGVQEPGTNSIGSRVCVDCWKLHARLIKMRLAVLEKCIDRITNIMKSWDE